MKGTSRGLRDFFQVRTFQRSRSQVQTRGGLKKKEPIKPKRKARSRKVPKSEEAKFTRLKAGGELGPPITVNSGRTFRVDRI